MEKLDLHKMIVKIKTITENIKNDNIELLDRDYESLRLFIDIYFKDEWQEFKNWLTYNIGVHSYIGTIYPDNPKIKGKDMHIFVGKIRNEKMYIKASLQTKYKLDDTTLIISLHKYMEEKWKQYH